MNATELKAILTGLGPGLNAAIAKSTHAATASLLARIDELEAKIAAVPEGKQGAQGIPGDPGPPIETAVLLNMIAEAVALAVAEIPPAQDGKDGASRRPRQGRHIDHPSGRAAVDFRGDRAAARAGAR